mgnify:CR=1 FL=1
MDDIRLYDFKKSKKFSLENIRNLTVMCEEFCKTSNMQINYETKSNDLRMSVNKSMQSTYGEFIESIDNDNIVIEYSILPTIYNLTLFIDKVAILSIVDLLLGGNGQVEDLNREPTNIDLELLKYLFDNLLKRIYMPATHEKIEVNRIYPNKIQYQKLNTKDMIFSSLINVLLQNEVVGHIRFCIPYESMKDIIDDFGSDKLKHEDNFEEEKCKDISCSEIFPYIKNIDVDVTAKLGCAKVSISDLLNLEVGDVILLDQKINEDITINIGDAKAYKAKPGILGSKNGVEITDIIR